MINAILIQFHLSGPSGSRKGLSPSSILFYLLYTREKERKGGREGVREGETGRWGGGRENTQAGAHAVAFTCGIILLALVSPNFE